MRPKAEHLHDMLRLEHLINKPVLNVDATRVCVRKITNQLFVSAIDQVIPFALCLRLSEASQLPS